MSAGNEGHSAVPREISRRTTWMVAIAAIGTEVLAGLALFRTTNGAGTAAAFVTAVILAIIAILGRVPRMKVGDHEIDPGASVAAQYVAEAARETAERTDNPEEVASAAEAARDRISSWTPVQVQLARRQGLLPPWSVSTPRDNSVDRISAFGRGEGPRHDPER